MSDQPSHLKRFLVFAYDQYYPNGGWNDYQGCYDNLKEVRNCIEWVTAETCAPDFVDVVDARTGQKIELAKYDESATKTTTQKLDIDAISNHLMALPYPEALALLEKWRGLVEEAKQGQVFLFKG